METGGQSPSSRRAWIEIIGIGTVKQSLPVALLAEGVDRNRPICNFWVNLSGSPSSRRAWIEIYSVGFFTLYRSVALLAEGVDRNTLVVLHYGDLLRRPPRGGRG